MLSGKVSMININCTVYNIVDLQVRSFLVAFSEKEVLLSIGNKNNK